MKLPHVNDKPQARMQILVQTQFSHSTLKLGGKNVTPQKKLAFLAALPNQNQYSNLTSKIMKMCDQILKDTSIQFKFFEM